ncbi:MAG: divalent metal cation transporter [Turicibacter sp.]|nr:divalent metal cation transporter [Turicibacter sp.]
MTKKKMGGTLLSAAFIMAASAVGPGFLTQTAVFTGTLQGSFGFVILVASILACIVQLNIWRVLCVSGLRGQDVANKILPGLGHFVAFLIILGGIAFNIGNVGGGALGLNSMLGVPEGIGFFVAGIVAIAIFLVKDAMKAMDNVTKALGSLMIVVMLVVIFMVRPPMGYALREAVAPSNDLPDLFFPILTLLGGTVGGYITFSGAHRLIDAKITGWSQLTQIRRSSVMGIIVATVVRAFLFLAVLGVVLTSVTGLNPDNPAADAFSQAAGQIGYRFFGLVLFSAALTSIIGAAYTSVSFLKTLNGFVARYEKWFIIGFIALSTVIMAAIGRPATLLVLAGALNGLILPITLGVCLIASQNKKIMGADYRHPPVLFVLGILVAVGAAYMGVTSLGGLMNLIRR